MTTEKKEHLALLKEAFAHLTNERAQHAESLILKRINEYEEELAAEELGEVIECTKDIILRLSGETKERLKEFLNIQGYNTLSEVNSLTAAKLCFRFADLLEDWDIETGNAPEKPLKKRPLKPKN